MEEVNKIDNWPPLRKRFLWLVSIQARHLKGRVTEEQMLSQIDYTLRETDLTGVQEINFFTIGSFYNDAELSLEFRKKSLGKFARLKNIKRVTVEGRAEYLTVEKLKTLIKHKIFPV